LSKEYSMILSTFPDKTAAKRAAKMLVEQRLAACVQMFPLDSVYLWKGEICEDGEMMLFIKSRTELFDKVSAAIREVHPYEVPEIVQVPITDGLPEYLQWIGACTI